MNTFDNRRYLQAAGFMSVITKKVVSSNFVQVFEVRFVSNIWNKYYETSKITVRRKSNKCDLNTLYLLHLSN